MTKKEAILCLSVHSSTNGSGLCTDEQHYEAKQMAIKALEQQPCTDAISRKAAIDAFGLSEKTRKYGGDHSGYEAIMRYEVQEIIESLPSVNPQANNEDIHREREQAYMKGYEDASKRYRTEPCGDAISRKAVLEGLARIAKAKAKSDTQKAMMGRSMLFVEQLPSVSAEKTGRWIMPVQDDGISDPIYYQVRCSECGFDLDPQTWHQELHQYGADQYCPKCGTFLGGDNNGYE